MIIIVYIKVTHASTFAFHREKIACERKILWHGQREEKERIDEKIFPIHLIVNCKQQQSRNDYNGVV